MDWDSIKNAKKPLGRFGPWQWAVEFVRGCNLNCWHCPSRIFPADGVNCFMSKSVWEAIFRIVAENTPYCRFEIGQCGEPTLHPHMFEFVSMAREISPTTQITTYTNGISLMKGDITYREMFDAGFHSIYVDMYAPVEKHIALAEASGIEWFMYNNHKIGSEGHERKANTYYNDPDMKLIILQDRPENRIKWRNVGRLSTFLNHIDWKASIPYGLVPVRESYERRCTIPQRFVTVSYEGDYTFCCIDFLCEACGLMGNVSEGSEGFKRYWFGRLMQSIRRRLFNKDRAGIPYCSRCNCAFSKCDMKIWPEETFDQWWDGKEWRDMSSLEMDEEVFADGWEKAAIANEQLPSEEWELECLKNSKRRIINTRSVVEKKNKMKGFFG